MAGALAADLLVGRVGHMAAGIAGMHLRDAVQVAEDRLQAPETAAAQGRDLQPRLVLLLLPLIDALLSWLSSCAWIPT